MKCHGCSSPMVIDRQESGKGSSTQWHSCPLCGKVRLTSHPERHMNAQQRSAEDQAADEIDSGNSGVNSYEIGTLYYA